MATLTADELANIRDWIGDSEPPDDFDLQTIYDRKTTLTKTVLSVLDKRLATLISGGPLSFTVVGEYSENRAANITALEKLIARVRAEGVGDEDGVIGKVTVGSLGRKWGR